MCTKRDFKNLFVSLTYIIKKFHFYLSNCNYCSILLFFIIFINFFSCMYVLLLNVLSHFFIYFVIMILVLESVNQSLLLISYHGTLNVVTEKHTMSMKQILTISNINCHLQLPLYEDYYRFFNFILCYIYFNS